MSLSKMKLTSAYNYVYKKTSKGTADELVAEILITKTLTYNQASALAKQFAASAPLRSVADGEEINPSLPDES